MLSLSPRYGFGSCFSPRRYAHVSTRMMVLQPRRSVSPRFDYHQPTISSIIYVNPNTRSIQQTKRWSSNNLEASKRNSWPKQALKLRVRHAQIGTNAGIILWDEITGGLQNMRNCIFEETHRRKEELISAGIDINTLKIPPIAHSTFLRFHQSPKSDCEQVQAKFRDVVLPFLNEDIPEVEVKEVTMVCERTPYMHIPDDEHHVLEKFLLID